MSKKLSLILLSLVLVSALFIYYSYPRGEQEVNRLSIPILPADYLQDLLVQSSEGRELIEGKEFDLDHRAIYWVKGDYPNYTVVKAKAVFWVGGKWTTTQVSSSEYIRRYVGGDPYIIEFDIINKTILSIEKADNKKLQEYWDTYYKHCKSCE
ncbi:hypothetical protein [Thermococcus sp. 2319x1]|uniref:hypothetical protein n=1 Tax=Thermococcus sp. 2319x1 TaxID=1674923 RepID=UPI001583A4E2|nr:hypothetical protein [Thermococcus sp. 2319x1]